MWKVYRSSFTGLTPILHFLALGELQTRDAWLKLNCGLSSETSNQAFGENSINACIKA